VLQVEMEVELVLDLEPPASVSSALGSGAITVYFESDESEP